MIKVATVCSGIGSPEQALNNLGIKHEISFACEIDPFARKTYLANFQPNQMLEDMTKQTWKRSDIFHKEDRLYSDLFIGGIPCQSFSLAGKRLGELDPRGLLFYDFYRYVQIQQPKCFIIENVKGLLSDDSGKTFRNWIQLLGRSENTHVNMFNHPDSLEYNLHWKVLNSKDFGVPQNRERVFLVGIRKDLPNAFRFPIGERLTIMLKDILEVNVSEKYYLSDKYLQSLITHSDRHQEKGNGFKFEPTDGNCVASAITTKAGQRTTDNYIKEPICVAMRGRNPENPKSRKSGLPTQQTLEINEECDIANTLDTVCNQAVIINPLKGKTDFGWHFEQNIFSEDSITRALKSSEGSGNKQKVIQGKRIRRLTPLECFRLQGYSDEFYFNSKYYSKKQCEDILSKYPKHKGKRQFLLEHRIDRMSDSQLYKQAGNTITVSVIQAIIKNLLL